MVQPVQGDVVQPGILASRSAGWCGAPERLQFHPCVPVQSGGTVRLNKLTSPLPVVQPAGAVHQKDSGFTHVCPINRLAHTQVNLRISAFLCLSESPMFLSGTVNQSKRA